MVEEEEEGKRKGETIAGSSEEEGEEKEAGQTNDVVQSKSDKEAEVANEHASMSANEVGQSEGKKQVVIAAQDEVEGEGRQQGRAERSASVGSYGGGLQSEDTVDADTSLMQMVIFDLMTMSAKSDIPSVRLMALRSLSFVFDSGDGGAPIVNAYCSVFASIVQLVATLIPQDDVVLGVAAIEVVKGLVNSRQYCAAEEAMELEDEVAQIYESLLVPFIADQIDDVLVHKEVGREGEGEAKNIRTSQPSHGQNKLYYLYTEDDRRAAALSLMAFLWSSFGICLEADDIGDEMVAFQLQLRLFVPLVHLRHPTVNVRRAAAGVLQEAFPNTLDIVIGDQSEVEGSMSSTWADSLGDDEKYESFLRRLCAEEGVLNTVQLHAAEWGRGVNLFLKSTIAEAEVPQKGPKVKVVDTWSGRHPPTRHVQESDTLALQKAGLSLLTEIIRCPDVKEEVEREVLDSLRKCLRSHDPFLRSHTAKMFGVVASFTLEGQ
uniref:Uncharacterized protein n=1 Tax=Palpitomonas bilix TaxID=652834 RepID=A0A7S3GE97_9EUKA